MSSWFRNNGVVNGIWRFDCVIKSNKTGCILTAWYCSCFVSLRTFDFRNEKAKKKKKIVPLNHDSDLIKMLL